MSDLTDQLDAIQKRSEGLTDLCAEHLRQSIRHVQRNCDIDCNIHEDEPTWDACKQPDRYDGDRMADALADIPTLLDLALEQQAAIDAVKAIHVPVMKDGEPVGCSACDWDHPVFSFRVLWPCPTIKALEAKP